LPESEFLTADERLEAANIISDVSPKESQVQDTGKEKTAWGRRLAEFAERMEQKRRGE